MALAQELPVSGQTLMGCSLCNVEAFESSPKSSDNQMVSNFDYESSVSYAENEMDSIIKSNDNQMVNSDYASCASDAEDEKDSIILSDSSEDGLNDDFVFVNLFSDSEDEVDFINMRWDGAIMNKPKNPWMMLEAGELLELKDEEETFLWVRYITTCWPRTSAALIQCIKLVLKLQ